MRRGPDSRPEDSLGWKPKKGSVEMGDRVFIVGPGEAFRVWQEQGPGERPRLLMNLDPQLAQSWSSTNGSTDLTIDCNASPNGHLVFMDGLHSMVISGSLNGLGAIMVGMVNRAGSGVAAKPGAGHNIVIGAGETFRVVRKAGPGTRESVLMELNPARGRLWTTSNVTTDRIFDANGALAIAGDAITSFVEDMKVWFPGMFNANAETAGGVESRKKPHDFKLGPRERFRVVYRSGTEPERDLLSIGGRGIESSWTVSNLTADRSIDANGAEAVIGDAIGNLITDIGAIFPGVIRVTQG